MSSVCLEKHRICDGERWEVLGVKRPVTSGAELQGGPEG